MDVDAERARPQPGERVGRERAVGRGGFTAGGHGGHAVHCARADDVAFLPLGASNDAFLPRGGPHSGRRWNHAQRRGTLVPVRALDPMLVGRRHVDLARVSSALCPAC
ncbi:putative leader peptide [Actinomycetospora sp. NBRC 106378]|uniref:putative leader peptide n=1 Tax=Actinomycetospora sp. NBRC 106378 TaxID=3032208 RepID=UPI00331CC62F